MDNIDSIDLDQIIHEEVQAYFKRQMDQDEHYLVEEQHSVPSNLDTIEHKIKPFADYIYQKYGNAEPMTSIIRFAQQELRLPQVQRNFQLTDKDFPLFIQYFAQTGGNTPFKAPTHNPIEAKLGQIIWPGMEQNQITVEEQDSQSVSEILNMAHFGRNVHVLTANQSMLYEHLECARFSRFDAQRDQIMSSVHPLIVALFAPKVQALDNRFLVASLADIVKERVQGGPLRSRPNFELYVDLCSDRNEKICSENVFEDLRIRVLIQEMLRKTVHNMRQGIFFTPNSNGFLMSLDQCKQAPTDNPDLIYSRDESVLLKRLLNLMAFRPTHVSTVTLGIMPNTPVPHALVYQLPMIQCNLPSYKSVEILQQGDGYHLSLLPHRPSNGSYHNQQYMTHGNIAQPIQPAIMYTHDVIFFYVNRRLRAYAPEQLPYDFLRMPMHMTGLQKINYVQVNVKARLHKSLGSNEEYNPFFEHDEYKLRSVVCVRPHPRNVEYAAGCFTMLYDTDKIEGGPTHIYDPFGLKNTHSLYMKYLDNNDSELKQIDIQTFPKPSTQVIKSIYPNKIPDAHKVAESLGTIYMYAKDSAATVQPFR